MKKLTILCDADDTIAELTVHWLRELNQRYNCNVQKEDITDWNITTAFPGLSEEEVLEPLYHDEFWSRTTPVDESPYYLEKLVRDGHNLRIVTASNAETLDAKKTRLLEMFPFLSREQIIREENKQSIEGDILIDDGVHNLINGRYKKLLFNQPGNSRFNEKEYGITRVYSWKEIYEKIAETACG